ncbi:hypothetical protein M0802_001612 [Mischocyttarus mexicanus]|nr:hypothetical protein M0802_001612 [Mischocyttarus mexicanus]
MKLVALLAVFVVIGVSSDAAPLSNSWEFNALDRDIYDFVKLMPVGKMIRLTVKFRNDPETQRTLKWVAGDEFHSLLLAVENLQEFKNLVLYVQEAGYNEIREIQIYHLLTGMADFVPPHRYDDDMQKELEPQEYASGGFSKYLSDLVALIPRSEIERLHNKKFAESPAFIKFHNAIHAPEYKKLKTALDNRPEYQRLVTRTLANGLDIKAFEDFKYLLLGFIRKL